MRIFLSWAQVVAGSNPAAPPQGRLRQWKWRKTQRSGAES